MKRQILWIAIVLAVVAVSFSAYAGDHEYVGAAKCKMCHKVQYASWEGTNHAKATETAKASTDREFGADCLKCHATNASEDGLPRSGRRLQEDEHHEGPGGRQGQRPRDSDPGDL